MRLVVSFLKAGRSQRAVTWMALSISGSDFIKLEGIWTLLKSVPLAGLHFT